MNREFSERELFIRYMQNQMEQENAEYNEGDILLCIEDRETGEFPSDWDNLCHLSDWVIGDPDDPLAPDLFPFSIHAVCGANYYLRGRGGAQNYLFLILERAIKIPNGIEIIGNQVTCPKCAGETILNINSQLHRNGVIGVIALQFPKETLTETRQQLEALWEEHLVLPNQECETEGHQRSTLGNPHLCQRCGKYEQGMT